MVMISQRRGRETPMLSVEYSYPAEPGGTTNGKDLLPADSLIPGRRRPDPIYSPAPPIPRGSPGIAAWAAFTCSWGASP